MASIEYTPALVVSAGVIFPVLCTAFVGARFYVRRVHGPATGIDDWLCVPSLLLLIGFGAAMCRGVAQKAIGYPSVKVPLGAPNPTRAHTREILFATELMQIAQLGFLKLSFCALYRRIFTTSARSFFNVAAISLIVVCTLWTVAFWFSYLFVCGTHFSTYWEAPQKVEQQVCVETTILNNSFAISDFIIDIMIFLLPIPSIWRLHMTTARKVAVTGVFGLGALTIVASTMRMAIYIQSNAVLFSGKADVSMLTTGGIYWSMIESGLGLMAACMPVLYKLFKVKGLQSIVASVRDIIQLRSRGSSRGSRGSRRANNSNEPTTSASQGSNINMVHDKNSEGQASMELASHDGHEYDGTNKPANV